MKGKWLNSLFHPPAEISKSDNSLRFTDILFGFVLKELFIRLADWPNLPGFIRWQLVVSSTLVLGSWIGYRRSANRSTYEIKFINLPFVRFVTDQAMLVLYFRLATFTPNPFDVRTVNIEKTVSVTMYDVIFIFGLYLVWDLLGIWISKTSTSTAGLRYPAPEGTAPNAASPKVDIAGTVITCCSLLFLVIIRNTMGNDTNVPLGLTTGILLIYRMAKEIRTSIKLYTAGGTYK